MIQNNIYIFIDCFEAVIILIYLESDKNVIAQIAKKFQIFHWLDTKKKSNFFFNDKTIAYSFK